MPSPRHDPPEIRRLVRHLRAIGDARWAEDYLAAARLLVDTLGLEVDDPRLCTSLPKSTAQWLLPITLNNRYVLAAERARPDRLIGVIWHPHFDKIPRLRRSAVRTWRFSPHRGEDPLDTPWFVRFRHPRLLLEDDELRDGWLDAARLELERRSASPYHRHHSYTAFRLIADAFFQRRVLGEVLSAG